MDYVISLNTIASSSYIDEDSASLIISDQNSNTLSRFDESFRLNNYSSMEDELGVISYGPDSVSNLSVMSNHTKHDHGYRDSLTIILPITICYLIIFIAGVLGNVITCIVIAKNKTMHTATNYYLFNLAVSDFLVLMFGEFFKMNILMRYNKSTAIDSSFIFINIKKIYKVPYIILDIFK